MHIRQETPADYPVVYSLIKDAFASAEHCDGNEQDLAAALGRVVDVPVVAAAGLEGNVGYADLLAAEAGEVALADEVLSEGGVLLTAGEDSGEFVHVLSSFHKVYVICAYLPSCPRRSSWRR